MKRTERFEVAVQQFRWIDWIETQGNFDFMLARLNIRQGKKPHHVRVHHWKPPRLNIRKYAEQGVFARRGVDMDRVAGYPGKE